MGHTVVTTRATIARIASVLEDVHCHVVVIESLIVRIRRKTRYWIVTYGLRTRTKIAKTFAITVAL